MTLRRFLALSAPGYAALFAIHLRNSLGPLEAGRVPPDLGYSAAAHLPLQYLQLATFAYLFVVYGWMLLAWTRSEVRPRDVATTTILLALAAWTLLPANSSDILEYLGFGRLFGLYHLNPYSSTYSEVTDWFSTYVTWDDPMPYGPPLVPLFTLAGVLTAVHLLVGVYALKLLWTGIHLANTWLVYRIAGELTDDPGLAAVAFACNPLLLVELLGNGHNDAVLILCGLLAVFAAQRGHGALALLCAFLGGIVKLAGIFWVLPIAVLLVRRRHWRALSIGAAACAAAALVVVLWPGCLDALTVLNSQWHYSEDSLHSIVINRLVAAWSHLPNAWDYDDVFQADRMITTPLFLLFVAWRSWRVRDTRSLVRESACIFLALLLGYAVSVGAWYFTWLLPMAVLTDSARVRRTVLVACVSAVLLYAFPFSMVEPVRLHEGWAAVRLAVGFGPPIVFLAAYPALSRLAVLLRQSGMPWMVEALGDRT